MIDWNEVWDTFKQEGINEYKPTFKKYFGGINDPLPNMKPVDAEKFWHQFSAYGVGYSQGYRQIVPVDRFKEPVKSVHYFIYHDGTGFAIHVNYDYKGEPKWTPEFYEFALCEHERKATMDTVMGWHEGHCTKCGLAINYDSSD